MSGHEYDAEVIRVAAHTAPIFAANGWTYAVKGGRLETPELARLADVVQYLVDAARSADVELDVDGYGFRSHSTGRWTVTREVKSYAFDPPDDRISISLRLGEINLTPEVES